MATTTSQKYYWIKLKTDFFGMEAMDFLLSQKNGSQYVVLYQMLCLMTANNDGRLCSRIGDILLKFDVDKIVRETKYFDYDTVVIALELFKKLGMIYEEEDGIIRISDIDDMVGSETEYAQKKREYRARKALEVKEPKELLPEIMSEKDEDDVEDISVDSEKTMSETMSETNSKTMSETFSDKRLDIRDIDIKKENIKRKKESEIEIFENEFESLWAIYPNKKGKPKALKAYIIARKNGTTYEQVKKGIEDYIRENELRGNKDPAYIKHGSTWFNQNCWNDEYNMTVPCNNQPYPNSSPPPPSPKTEFKLDVFRV